MPSRNTDFCAGCMWLSQDDGKCTRYLSPYCDTQPQVTDSDPCWFYESWEEGEL